MDSKRFSWECESGGCSLEICGSETEVVETGVLHSSTMHKTTDSDELRSKIKSGMKPEESETKEPVGAGKQKDFKEVSSLDRPQVGGKQYGEEQPSSRPPDSGRKH